MPTELNHEPESRIRTFWRQYGKIVVKLSLAAIRPAIWLFAAALISVGIGFFHWWLALVAFGALIMVELYADDRPRRE